ncbi:XTP/dITP diphosphatase, partial [Turicibacter sanguinis]|nr:XTP/dITP diphosphatase [Turicibacter sanguinis]
IFNRYNIQVKSLLDLGDVTEIEENGETFEENALIKAREIAKKYKKLVIADDSGLEVDALNKRPGVYSARYAGEGRDDAKNIDKVLTELEGIEEKNRSARFVCALALVTENGEEYVVRGECEGQILTHRQGNEGFGYDPIFYLPSIQKTMAEIPKSEKNVLSHRADAFKKLENVLMDLM